MGEMETQRRRAWSRQRSQVKEEKLKCLRAAADVLDRVTNAVAAFVVCLGVALVSVNRLQPGLLSVLVCSAVLVLSLILSLPLSPLPSTWTQPAAAKSAEVPPLRTQRLWQSPLLRWSVVGAAAWLSALPQIAAPNSQRSGPAPKKRDGPALHVVPPSATLLQRIALEIGPQYAAMFNSTGNKLRSFKRAEMAAGQWEVMADRWVQGVRQTKELWANNSPATAAASSTTNVGTASNRSSSSSSKGPLLPLLCVHFARASPAVVAHMHANMASAGDWCHWAIVFYAGDAAVIGAYREVTRGDPRIALVSAYSPPDGQVPEFVPKPLLYAHLLPVLHLYRRVWLLDSDISLEGFDIGRYMSVLGCAERAGPVLISQPVIRESTQDFPLFNRDFWAQRDLSHIQAARCVPLWPLHPDV